MAFHTINKGSLEFLTADAIGVPHGFTTRFGGVSEGYLASLNLGLNRGDDPRNVAENFRILGEGVGYDPENLVFTRQIHSDIVRAVSLENRGEGLCRPVEPECDALITDTPGVVLAAFTADCTPILLHDPVTGAVGAVHAGWRGTVADIAGKTVEAMGREFGAKPEHIRAAIGPNIGFCCFQTDRDVPDAVRGLLGEEAEEMIRFDGRKYYVDLKRVNEQLLRRRGVNTVDISGDCTVCQSHRFWSHRATGGQRGAQGAVIVCRGRGE